MFGFSTMFMQKKFGAHFLSQCKVLQPVAKLLMRLCTIFWHKQPVHDLVLVIPPPPLIKVASNTRLCSKRGGTTLNGREEGGQYYKLSHRSVTSSDLKHERLFFHGSVSTFLQLNESLLLLEKCKRKTTSATQSFWKS